MIAQWGERLEYEAATPILRWSTLARRSSWDCVKLYPMGCYWHESIVGVRRPSVLDRGSIFRCVEIGQLDLFAGAAE